ncbi:MAG TPA: tungsten cofactor oxidoreductase radical SAM maturase [Spirochaetes bacterium]|nr:tungsten cofactor oxidoreductase radical SAM maturase [Spirochaetota bacterium]
MPKVILSREGSIKFPEEFTRQLKQPHNEWWLDRRDGTVLLLPRLPDLRKIYVEPSSHCNLSCRMCVRKVWDDPDDLMEMDLFYKLISETKKFPELQRIVLSGLGEPLTHPDLLEMIRVSRERGLTVTLGSNGILLDKAILAELVKLGVDRLVISLDGTKPETYSAIRGAVISKVLDNIRLLNEAKKRQSSLKPALCIEFVAQKSNISELAGLTGLASKLGASRVIVSNVLAYSKEMVDEILYGYGPRAPFTTGSWPVQSGAWVQWGILALPRMHWGSEQSCRFVKDRSVVIGWDGGVSPCYALSHNYSYFSIDGRRKQVSRYSLGNIKDRSLLEIWTSEEYCRFRNEVRDFHFPSCPDCDLRETCDLREQNGGCWGWNPSCADCLWAQGIIRCP